MKTNINLLPVELVPKTNLVKLSSFLKLFVIAGFMGFLVLAAIGGAILILLSTQAGNSQNRVDSFKSQVTALKKTEQGLFLLKDRIDKVKVVLNSGIDEKINKTQALITNISPEVSLKDAEISHGKSEFGFDVPNSESLSEFLNKLYSMNLYQKINLKTLTFNSSAGYSITLEVF
ncbi:hypothetical protein A3D00_04300 [Candidatus Woesebacteria bacterium RIFCSPHIGHO2_02_FULL_38_9]|uniref:Uncharacterized protein n=1 Tax=Candidatus Woesebacteria bacterium RIFCSPHIGHO2_01_FULL_39_28 TaxID=1802496 RepID=A0A1F7YD09_9BACT|nr:MAG: hypothetical protein A2627_00175 [Candidatus Woesebacteria bacterium RIFCSPHIGHO2_01_FULL_39_28]OGM32390.1 MAG: hypothetical protein A3D00_04300 [Candidatus Woesebacteria bacterium RIFCSPHIGHO2_02_FULL_38_9]OGM57887.1 MAG: hypothetical protein A3A50_04605 [Candidatus Woesebacteria bacterium RIFCSPLOWO2_01_FULL_38_20]